MSPTVLNCGYVPLVDCAPLVIAKELGFAAEEGLELSLIPQPSWSALRDMLALGHLHAAQMLSPMPVAMSLGLGGLTAEIDALMVLSVNGTVFGISQDLGEKLRQTDGAAEFGDPDGLPQRLANIGISHLRIGVPFHHSMHRLLLEYWLNGQAEQADLEVEIVTVPPVRMADAIEQRQIDAFWVGEPWGSAAVSRGVAELLLPGSAIWAFAPEKVLAARREWLERNPDDVRRLLRAVHQAARWLDTPKNKPLAVEILARSEHLNLAPELIDPAISGQLITHQKGFPVSVEHFLLFHKRAAHFPWRSQAAWIAKQLGASPDGIARAKQCFRSDIYRQMLGGVGADLPGASEKIEGSMRHATAVASTRGHMILGPDAFFDGKTFDFSGES
ncbi:CmpA/NrtA family ABC transporter substrate-binding protein [Litoreibacter roseus]|uniref:Nitrate transporter n=1 Tax=Litoreibacter roseus TaxID=2601869 RepID=A0A6N6JJL8_9RHOB|nr:CmpA/NrtA family ABC transporter substrate-binding protein [Litoreibacter roseus]GFE66476.1 nitrate transporter [Litoreibacter roseus]